MCEGRASEFQNETIVVENGILDEQLSDCQTLVVIQQLRHKTGMSQPHGEGECEPR